MKSHQLKFGLALAALAAVLPGVASAEDRPAEEKGVLSFVGENDSLSSGADRNYTSGVKLAYVSPSEGVPDWLRSAGGFTRALSGAEPRFWGVALGQSIFTPENIAANPAPPTEHPYAGWLYAQIMVAAEEDTPAGVAPGYLDTYELEFGVVGPMAGGEEAQRGLHQFLGAPDPKGWDSQLENEFAFAASFERRWRALRVFADTGAGGLEADLTPNAGVTLGTLRTEARAGLTARIGYNIDSDYGPPRVRPSLSGVEHFGGGFSWSVFAGVQARAVARNLFLDGNTFIDDGPSVEGNPLVGEAQLGASVSAGDWRLSYTYVMRTEEFETQTAEQDFGALALSVRF